MGMSPHSPDGTMLSAVDAKSFATAAPGKASVTAHASSATLLIDPSKLASTGASGAGTLTDWLVGQPAIDDRLERRICVIGRNGLLHAQARAAVVQLQGAHLVVEPRLASAGQAPADIGLAHGGRPGQGVGGELHGPLGGEPDRGALVAVERVAERRAHRLTHGAPHVRSGADAHLHQD